MPTFAYSVACEPTLLGFASSERRLGVETETLTEAEVGEAEGGAEACWEHKQYSFLF